MNKVNRFFYGCGRVTTAVVLIASGYLVIHILLALIL